MADLPGSARGQQDRRVAPYAVDAGMRATPVRVHGPVERNARFRRHPVERALGPDLVETRLERLGRVEAADHRGARVAGQPGLLIRLHRLSVPAHEHMFARRADGKRRSRAGTSRLSCSPTSVWLLASWISTSTYSPGWARPAKLTTLLWRVRPRRRRRVGARRPLDEHLERAPDEALRALAGAPLDDLDEALHALDLLLVRHAVLELGRLRPPPRREDERERAVVADLLDDLERLAKSASVSPGKPTMTSVVSAHVGHVLADQRDAVQVALARVGAPHRLEDRATSRTAAAGGCARRPRAARRGRGSRPRACPSDAGSCSGCGAMPSIASSARSSSANVARSGRRSRP